MGPSDAPHGEMPGFPFSSRPDPEADDLLGMILDGQSLPPDAPGDIHALAETLAALSGPAGPDELAGEAAVRSAVARKALARTASPAGVSAARPDRNKAPRRAVPPSTRVAAGLVAATIGLGGTTAAAAYTGALPGPIQDFAHRIIHAPPAHHRRPHPDKDKPSYGKHAKPKAPASPKAAKANKSPKPAKPPKPEGSPQLIKPPKRPKPGTAKASPEPAKALKPQPPPSPGIR
jgi:hypothetical protein